MTLWENIYFISGLGGQTNKLEAIDINTSFIVSNQILSYNQGV